MSDIVILYAGDSARLTPTHSGFAHGFGIFETIKLSAGRLCFWEAHWARLSRSASEFRLQLDRTAEAVLEAIGELVRAEGIRDGVVKLSLLADEGAAPSSLGHASSPRGVTRSTRLFVYTRPVIPSVGTAQLKVLTESPLNEGSPLAGHKTHNYMENMLLLEAARAGGYSDVIRVNAAGSVTETAVGNLFFIEGRQLSTPALGTGILPGVIRGEVLAAAAALGISVEEGAYLPEQLQHADALFITNSTAGIRPVQALEADAWRVTLPSEIHPMLLALTEALAVSETRNSIDL